MTARNPADGVTSLLYLFSVVFVLALLLLARWVVLSIRAQIRANRNTALGRLKQRVKEARRAGGTFTW